MKGTDYVYAVGRIRAKELSLLSSSDMRRLISSKTYGEAVTLLSSKGYVIGGENYTAAISKQHADLWQLMKEVLRDITQMNPLIIKNDYQNLKAAVKAAVTGNDASSLLVSPSVYEPEKIYNAVVNRKFNELPSEMISIAEKAYDILVRTHSAQLADAVCDKAAMLSMLEYSKNKDSKIFSEISECIVACTDIKIVYRSILAGKTADFMCEAVCPCRAFSPDTLVKNADSVDDFLAFLEKTPYSGAAEALKTSVSAYEKYCDDMLMSIVQKGKMTAFGIDPIVAYYMAKEAELLSVRIVLSGKLNGADESIISGRVRELYA